VQLFKFLTLGMPFKNHPSNDEPLRNLDSPVYLLLVTSLRTSTKLFYVKPG